MREIIFEIRDDETDGGFVTTALGHGIHAQADTMDDLKQNIRSALDCYFDDPADMPRIVRLHFVRDEVMAV